MPAPPALQTEDGNHRTNGADPPSDDDRNDAEPTRSRRRRRRTKRSRSSSALTKKLEFMTHLLSSLDQLFFLEIAYLYYLECSFLRFLLRSVAQYAFFTPKPESFPIALPAYPAHVFSILFPNVLCILCHVFMTLPKGTEASRGYLHGGIIIDFIGQIPPTSRFPLLAVDLCILSLQALMLAVHSQREALRGAVKPNRGSIDFLPELRRQLRAQTVDAGGQQRARRRRNRSDSTASTDHHDVEMGLVGSSDEPGNGDGDDETTRLISEQPTASTSGQQLSDIYASGNAVLGEFHLVQSMRLASTDYSAAAAHSIRTLGYTASLATLLATRESGGSGRLTRRSGRSRDRR